MNPSSDQPPPPANPLGLAPGSPCLRAAIVLAILLTTAGLLWAMAMLRPRAAFRPPEERIREVRVCELRKGAQRATYLGYGTVRPEREVELAAEVRGRIVHLRPGLKDGVLVAAGEELLRIDPADYEAMRDQAAAEVAQITASLERLDRREDDDRERLVLLERDVALVEINLMRLRSLAEHKASSASIAEQAEQAFLQRRNTLITLRSMIAQVPAERAELKARLAAASARERTTTLDIDRCRIVAPFPGRIGRLAVEAGQYVNVGQPLLRLSDDRELEIPVSVDVAEALRLGLAGGDGDHANWLHGIEGLTAKVTWVDAPAAGERAAAVVRIADVDAATRTVVLIVQPRPGNVDGVPLVAGMFCRVRLSGQEIPEAVLLPRSAIQIGNRFYLVAEGRLRGIAPAILQGNEDGFLVDGAAIPDGALAVAEKLPFGIIEGMQVRPVPAPSCRAPDAATERQDP